MTLGILLIAHGSRQAEANEDLHHVAAQLRHQGQPIVVAAFLELAPPDIDSGGALCVEQGATRVVMLPYFLSAGVHVRRDLTAAQQRLRTRFPDVDFRLADPLGRHPLLLDIVNERVQQAL